MKKPTPIRTYINEVRLARGHSFRAAEQACGMSLNTLSHFVRGRTQRFKTANTLALARYLRLPYEIVRAWIEHDVDLLKKDGPDKNTPGEEETITSDAQYLAIKTRRCDKCPLISACRRQVIDGLPAFCETLTNEDVAIIKYNGGGKKLKTRQNLIQQQVIQ